MAERGEWHQDGHHENPALTRGMTQSYVGILKAHTSQALRRILTGLGMTVLRCGGLGTLAGLCGFDALKRALHDDRLLNEFLHLCEHYDRQILPGGPGTRQRAGPIAVATAGG